MCSTLLFASITYAVMWQSKMTFEASITLEGFIASHICVKSLYDVFGTWDEPFKQFRNLNIYILRVLKLKWYSETSLGTSDGFYTLIFQTFKVVVVNPCSAGCQASCWLAESTVKCEQPATTSSNQPVASRWLASRTEGKMLSQNITFGTSNFYHKVVIIEKEAYRNRNFASLFSFRISNPLFLFHAS